jgi:hypothetical protein
MVRATCLARRLSRALILGVRRWLPVAIAQITRSKPLMNATNTKAVHTNVGTERVGGNSEHECLREIACVSLAGSAQVQHYPLTLTTYYLKNKAG